MSDESTTRDIIVAVGAVLEKVPLYQDLVQPAAKELGTGLGQAVHLALEPVAGLVWGWERIKEEFVNTKVAEKLSGVPPEDIITPPPNIAGPLFESVRFSDGEETLCDMYANLLATAMDSSTAQTAHPAFVEIIRQLLPDEARIIGNFLGKDGLPVVMASDSRFAYFGVKFGGANLEEVSMFGIEQQCEHPQDISLYLGNICRLGLAEMHGWSGHHDKEALDEETARLRKELGERGAHGLMVQAQTLVVTQLGTTFVRACVAPHARRDL
jgi:hypothetical protein